MEPDDHLEVYRDKRGKWRWRRIAHSGRVVGAASSGFERRRDAEANMTRGYVPGDDWTFFQDRKGAWRWRRFDSDGQIVGAACDGHATRADAVSNAMRHGHRPGAGGKS